MQLTDGDRIRGLLGTYCRLIDGGDFAGIGTLFAAGTLHDAEGALLATGSAEVEALYRSTTRLHADGTPMTQHVVANTTFDEGLGDDAALARSSYVVLQRTSKGLQPIITGWYVDSFGRDENGWHFSDRTFGVGRLGDLSEHLTFNPGDLK